MSQLDRIEQMCTQILAKLGEAPAVTSGVTHEPDGTPFLPGTGRLGGSRAHQPPDEPGRPADPAERARILKLIRASRAASPTQETP